MKLLILAIASCLLFAEESIHTNESQSKKENYLFSPFKEKTLARSSSRNSSFESYIVGQSKNGYGGYSEINNPLAYSHGGGGLSGNGNAGWVVAFRQLLDIDETAGFLAIAQSGENIDEWYTNTVNTKYPEFPATSQGNWGWTYQYEGIDTLGNGCCLPTPDGSPGARFPNAIISPSQDRPGAVWNEYTLSAYGGGDYGGVPMYIYDQNGLGEFSIQSPMVHLNNGCVGSTFGVTGTSCDPPDLWTGNAQLIDGNDGSTRIVSVWQSWAPDISGSIFGIRSINVANGYVFFEEEPTLIEPDSLKDDGGECLWYECEGYNGRPDFHINNSGVGYMGFTAWTGNSDFEPPYLHTIFFKKTEDYGVNWTVDEGYKNSGYYFIPDEEIIELQDSLLTLWSLNPDEYPNKPYYPWAQCTDEDGNLYGCGDTIRYSNDPDSADHFFTPAQFLHYTYDILTDEDGGLHFVTMNYPWVCKDYEDGCDDNSGGGIDGQSPDGIADSVAWENRFGGAGFMHYYNPNPIENPRGWRATLIEDFSDAMYADWPEEGDMKLFSDPINVFSVSIRPSFEEGSNVLWYASNNMSRASWSADSLYIPGDVDVFMAKSVDNGRSWTTPENVTQDAGALEYGVHLANVGSDYDIGVYYQTPDLSQLTVPDNDGWIDYVNNVNIGRYENDIEFLANSEDESPAQIPSSFELNHNYPNPFNPVTNIGFSIKKRSNVTLSLYDVRGKYIKELYNHILPEGNHNYELDASDLSSGVYFYTMVVNGVSKTKKLILLK